MTGFFVCPDGRELRLLILSVISIEYSKGSLEFFDAVVLHCIQPPKSQLEDIQQYDRLSCPQFTAYDCCGKLTSQGPLPPGCCPWLLCNRAVHNLTPLLSADNQRAAPDRRANRPKDWGRGCCFDNPDQSQGIVSWCGARQRLTNTPRLDEVSDSRNLRPMSSASAIPVS